MYGLNDEPIQIISNGVSFDKNTIIEAWKSGRDEYDVYGYKNGELILMKLNKLHVFSLGQICPDADDCDLGI